ncbi:Histone-like bacterial DNA-binding protein [gut metagenome]|uniref:Histone-like bacterial DNA-binding protein n=1 Tax=gut metagenome TaxID=749906 RepID=J9BT61_9ZZZZ
MIRKDIAYKLAERMDLTPIQAEQAVRHVVDIITHSFVKGESLYIRGFATIKVVKCKAAKGRNFTNGETVSIPAFKKLQIKTSKFLLQAMNSKE